MTSTDFDVLRKFVGSGNPEGKFWFIGIEEADECDFDGDRVALERYKKQISPVGAHEIQNNEEKKIVDGKRFTKIYDYMSYLVLDTVVTRCEMM